MAVLGCPDDGVVVTPYAGEHAEWDAYVRRTRGGSVFHLTGWKALLEETLGLRSHYLVARRGGEIHGVLPLFELHAPWMERRLLSVPFAVEAGVCSVDAGATRALDAAAIALARWRNAGRIEIRDGRTSPDFRIRDGRYFRFRRPLHDSDDANLAALPAKRRNMVRQGIRHGLTARVDAADVTVFHDLYARTVRRFGTPVFPQRFFRALLERLPDTAVLLTVHLNDTPVAGALAFVFGETISPYYVGSRREYFRYAVNDFLYWELMRYGCARGARQFDFGRSKIGTGAFRFKQLWGCAPEPLRYRIASLDESAPHEHSSDDGAIAVLQRMWRLVPLPLTKLLGPFFVTRYGAYYT